MGFLGGSDGKESTCNERLGFHPWVGKIPWRRAWQPTPVFFPGESHGQRSLVGYSPWDCKESDTAERLTYNKLHVFEMCTLMSFDTSIYTHQTITTVKKITYLGSCLPVQWD